MFEILKDQYVDLMLKLSSESGDLKSFKSELENTDLDKMYRLAEIHELDGVIASKIIKYGLAELPECWENKYKKEKERLSFLKNKAAEICNIMYNNGIKMVVLKNGGIMNDIIKDPAACPMEDIDSLVRKSDFKKAHEILINNGFVFKFRSSK